MVIESGDFSVRHFRAVATVFPFNVPEPHQVGSQFFRQLPFHCWFSSQANQVANSRSQGAQSSVWTVVAHSARHYISCWGILARTGN
jgi:hypothetical protein